MSGGDLSVSGGDRSVGGAEGALRPVTTAGVHRDIVVTLKGMSAALAPVILIAQWLQ